MLDLLFSHKPQDMENQVKDRVKEATPSSINEDIEREMWNRVGKLSVAGNHAITKRITELEEEWDIERYLGVNMSTLALIGLGASVKNKAWLALPAVVLGFFMQHSIQGWCPPLPILRSLKIRNPKGN